MRIVLKELKECRTALSIVSIKKMIEQDQIVQEQLKEGEELIAIVATSISTAEKNRANEEKNERKSTRFKGMTKQWGSSTKHLTSQNWPMVASPAFVQVCDANGILLE